MDDEETKILLDAGLSWARLTPALMISLPKCNSNHNKTK